MPHIRFLTHYTVKGTDGEQYQVDQVLSCSTHTMMHFLARGVAVQVEDPTEEPPAGDLTKEPPAGDLAEGEAAPTEEGESARSRRGKK